MADDPVLWSELKEYCAGQQQQCHAVHEERRKSARLESDAALHGTVSGLHGQMATVLAELKAVRELLDSSRLTVLPTRVLYLLLAGMIGVGMAGERIAPVIVAWIKGAP